MIVEARALSFQYPGSALYPASNFALRDVSFTVRSGEILALCGSNGSGKTTLGKLLCGLLKPQSGAIYFDDEESTSWSLGQFGKHIGYLFQEPARQIFAPTVLQDLTFVQEISGVSAEGARARAMELLLRFDLAGLAEQGSLTLSRGEQQRLAICGLLLNRPKVLVFDEPTTGLEARRKDIFAAALHECLKQGVSVLIISHDRAFITAHATRQVKMEGGVLHV